MISKDVQDRINELVKEALGDEAYKPPNAFERARDHVRAEVFDKMYPALQRAWLQRDDNAQAFSQAYYLVVGHSPKWSDTFKYEDALEEIKEHCSIMRAALRDQR